MNDHESRIKELLQPDEQLILLTDTDIDRNGAFGQRWLVVTDSRLMTFPGDGLQDGPELEVALKDLKTVTPTHRVGQMALEAEANGRKVELIRCSNSLSEKFSRVARSLNEASKEKKAPTFDLKEELHKTCPKCGRLLPERGGFCPACLKKTQVLARLWRYARRYWPMLLAITICVIVRTGMDVAPPRLTKTLVDNVLAPQTPEMAGGVKLLIELVVALLLLRVGSTGLDVLGGRLSAVLGSRVMHDVRFDFYQSVQGLSLRRYDKTQTGALMSRLTSDTSMLNFLITDIGHFVVPMTLQLVGICVMLLIMNWWLALLVLIPTPIVTVMTLVLFRRMGGLYHRLWQSRAKMSARANDSISGIRVVKAFSQEPKEIGQFRFRSAALRDATSRAESMAVTVYPMIWVVMGIGVILVWGVGGFAKLQGKITLGDLMAFIGYTGMLYGPLQWLIRYTDHINQAFTAAQRLFEITDADQEVYDDPKAEPLRGEKVAVNFENVDFGYNKDRLVIKDMTVDVKPGEMIGLVGRSGAGKTTMTNLICRFYDVDDGAIKFNDVDMRKLKLRDLRRKIGIVPQESYLFDGTIFENIAYAKPNATREEVIQAAIAANAHGFIMRLPDGYDTKVGERGARVSGGEKQRVAIARAILHDPKILILDEATSSVDTETEQLIQEALARLIQGRTTFAIAHRLSTLKNANRLLVIDEGKVAEFGTHDELLAKKGIYHRLVEMQSKLSALNVVDG